MKNSQHLGFWVMLALVGFLLSPLLRDGNKLQAYVQTEYFKTEQAMGPTLANWARSFADNIFSATPLSMVAGSAKNVMHNERDMKLSETVGGPMGSIMSGLYNSYLQGLILQSYVAAMRLALVLFWGVFLLPLFIASLYDGLMQRAVKQAEFGSIRPATFTLTGMLVIPLMALPILYLLLPITISPLLAPVWAALISMPLSLLVSNTQPLFGR